MKEALAYAQVREAKSISQAKSHPASARQDPGYNFYGNMTLYDLNDKEDIEQGLLRVFEFEALKINKAIAEQVFCGHGLACCSHCGC